MLHAHTHAPNAESASSCSPPASTLASADDAPGTLAGACAGVARGPGAGDRHLATSAAVAERVAASTALLTLDPES